MRVFVFACGDCDERRTGGKADLGVIYDGSFCDVFCTNALLDGVSCIHLNVYIVDLNRSGLIRKC